MQTGVEGIEWLISLSIYFHSYDSYLTNCCWFFFYVTASIHLIFFSAVSFWDKIHAQSFFFFLSLSCRIGSFCHEPSPLVLVLKGREKEENHAGGLGR